MIRGHLAQATGWGDPDFRWRGGDVSRIEALSDAVFALALALLFVGTDPPTTYRELEDTIETFPALLVCFVFVMMPWWAHFKFFRRLGIQDLSITVVNTALLFLVMFYVYPLRFLFTTLFAVLFGFETRDTIQARVAGADDLMIVYGAGFVGIFSCLLWLNVIGYRRRAEFELDALEVYLLRTEIHSHLIMVVVGLLSIGLTVLGVHGLWCGLAYGLIGPLQFARGFTYSRAVDRLRPQVAPGRAAVP